MASVERVGDLEVGQDLGFQRREWAVQRVAWVVAALIGVAALLGVLGSSGPFAHGLAEEGGLRVDYLRFERRHAPTELRIEAAPASAQQGQLLLWLDRSYVRSLEIDQIEPEPDQVEAAGERVVFTFLVADPNQPNEIAVPMQHDDWGVKTGRLGLVGGPEVAFRQVVYP
ncbi:MAG: hypothetical protein M3Q10_06385 [Chloroflexota bacterium]|nr:hypothetical protein [Chloroflexota bacterium]